MNLYFLKHNNYYNRRYKPITSLTGATVLGYLYNVSNFDPADGVDTVQETAYETFTDIPDYMLAMEGEEIISRWYVVEAKRIRGGKYRLTLHRDVIADYFADIEDAPMFIEKGYVPYSNPLIFNKEQISFNKVKKHEILLKDETKCPWIVAYVGKDSNGDLPTGGIKGTASNTNPEYDEALNSLIDWEYYDYCNFTTNRQTFYVGTYNQMYYVYERGRNIMLSEYTVYNANERVKGSTEIAYQGTTCQYISQSKLKSNFDIYKKVLNSNVSGQINTKPNSALQALINQAGKILRVGETAPYKYYKVKVESTAKTVDDYLSAGNMYNTAKAWVEASDGTNFNEKTVRFTVDTTSYEANLEDVTVAVSATFTYTTDKQALTDAPYTMVVAPYIDATLHFGKDGTVEQFPLTKSIQMEAMSNFVYNGQSYIYDYQLLPYCPIAGISTTLDAQGTDMYISNPAEKTYSFIDDSTSSHYGIVFYAQYSKFSKSIPMSSNTDYDYLTKVETDSVERKVKNECDLVRISSPNGSNSFDFSPQMNDGFDYIQVDCTYKPYSPYIHVSPDFAGLYGDNFGDTRGLIVQGDFSLPVINDAWKQYEINNKNYANVFDRETQSLEFKEAKRRTQQVASIIAGSVGGAGAGLALGSSGGPVGMAVGAAVGAGLSTYGGIVDYNISKELYNEQMDYRQDMYNMNLENIQARPNGLAKTSAFTNNNKIYPFIEYYTATDVEKEALRSKIKYNGMTIGVIGKIMDYVGSTETYVKGSLITSDISDDYHTVQSINNELNMGIRIGG